MYALSAGSSHIASVDPSYKTLQTLGVIIKNWDRDDQEGLEALYKANQLKVDSLTNDDPASKCKKRTLRLDWKEAKNLTYTVISEPLPPFGMPGCIVGLMLPYLCQVKTSQTSSKGVYQTCR